MFLSRGDRDLGEITEIRVEEEGDVEPHASQAADIRGEDRCSQLLRVYQQMENLTLVSCC